MKRHGSMNHIFRLVWSQVLNGWVAVAEGTRGRGKGSRRKLAAAALSLTALHAQAAPVGGQVISGAGSISQAGAVTTIAQSSQNLSLNWQGFNVAAQETVNFVQPSAAAIAVNRIFDTNGSQILGRINANGQVYLINPNGILFGHGSQVNVGGLVASTLDLNDAALASNTRSFSGNGSGSIVNQGTLSAATGGYVALLGNKVSNQGAISAPAGSIALGAGSAATLTFQNNSLVQMQVDQSVLDSLADNGGLIRADGGVVVMSAGARDALLASVVNNTGLIQARTVQNREGSITLLGGMTAGTANIGGTLDASAPDGGNGGFIETSAAHVKIANEAKVSTAAAAGRTGTWLIDPQDYTVAASGGDISGATLSSSLGTTNVELQSSTGGTAGSGDVNVNDSVSWSANTTLTLTASRNVNVNANISATGDTAGLVINPNTANGADAAGGGGFNLKGASVTLSGANPSLSIAGNAYTVINSLGAEGSTTGTDLQGANSPLGGYYALGSNIDATATSGWNGGAGFTPIGNLGAIFDGLGHSISNLTINTPNVNYVGLFSGIGGNVVIRNVGLVGGSVSGNFYVGGLLGVMSYNNLVSNSYSTASVTGSIYVGGLVGQSQYGKIANSYATGNVVGTNAGTGIGGLVGQTLGTVSNSYATGNVSGKDMVGGLMGHNQSSTVSNSYATGNVSGTTRVGGLAGHNNATINNSYATGSVTGSSEVGGIVGTVNNGSLNNSYATGSVSGGGKTGALVGYKLGTGSINNSHWNTDVSGGLPGIGTGSASGTTGLTAAQMLTQSNYSAWDFSNTWVMYEGHTLPLLRSFMTPITVTVNNASKVYDGQAYAGANSVTYSSTPNGNLLGALTYSGTWQGIINAGNYGVTAGGFHSTQQGYLISYVGGTLNVTPKALTATVVAPNKTYDGTTSAAPTLTITAGLVGTETLGAAGAATFNSKDVASANLVTVNSVTLSDGSNGGLASNYSLAPGQTVAASITKADLTLGSANVSKTYDAGLTAAGTAVVASGTLFAGDTLGGGSFAFTDKNVGSGNKTVTLAGVTVGDGAVSDNYNVSYVDNTTSTITKANLAVTGLTVAGKVYDATAVATLGGSESVAALGGDAVTVAGAASGSFDSKNVGSAKAVTVSGNSISGADAGNYNLVQQTGLSASVTKADLAVSGLTAVGKVYDGTTAATLSGSAVFVKLGTDDVTLGGVGGTFDSKNVGSGKTVTINGNSLGGADAGNYNLVSQSGLTAAITMAELVVTGLTALDKVYDATRIATLAGTASIAGLGADDVTLVGGASGTFDSKNAGSGKAITVSGNGLGGADAGNYQLVQQTGLTATVTQAKLHVTGLTALDKVYDATTAATLGGSASVAALNGDAVTVAGSASATFDSKNAGSGKAVTVSGNSLSGADAGNYLLVQQTGLSASVAKASLTVSGLTALDKVYDGTTIATLGGNASVAALGGDAVTLAGTASGAFDSKNVGSAKAVTVSGTSLSGVDAGNYQLVGQTSLSATVTKARLLVSGLTAVDKVYDGSTAATLSGTAALAKLGADDVQLGAASGSFDSKNVGSGKTVTINGASLTGADAGNYDLVSQGSLTASISKANLVVTGLTARDKVYDGTTAATLAGTATIARLGADDVTLGGAASATFDSKNVGSGKAVTVSGNSLSGADAGNYTLSQQAGLRAAITPATLTYTATPVTVFFGKNPGSLSGTVSGFAAGETVAQATTGALTWTTSAGPGSDLGSYPISGGGLVSANYVFEQAAANASALAVKLPLPPQPVVNVAAQLVSNVLSLGAAVQAPVTNTLPAVTLTTGAGNNATAGGDPSSSGFGAGATVNTTIAFGGMGTTLQIVSGGTRLPDDLANVNE
jgi:filamentous hemagglutinin family protein